ncbi:hypothetical protein CC78DRAFT_533434 [Lojkania enalia]|uniref:Pentatricopeptide repeat domain-containing protein n=1 Tax=Lojkania enalia TaxID=147567 RepID=A0A9P4KAF8_9PLEO|nr:hypothetical protein CC78DRAFT_533434 [Didymosphaeria enalia]
MPTALDRLLASPSALRALRSFVNASELPASCPTIINCRPGTTTYRRRSSNSTQLSLKNDAKARKGARSRVSIRKFTGRDTDINNPKSAYPKTLKIDNIKEHEKPLAWVQALQYQERVYRLNGVRHVWFAMMHSGFSLPTANTVEADFLWGTLIKHPNLFPLVLDHAALLQRKTGAVYPKLYEKCMAYWLPRHADRALEYHHLMVVRLRLRKLPLRQLAQLARYNLTTKSLEALMQIYQTSNERDIYDLIVPSLIDRGKFAHARRWHILCSHRKDLPSPAVSSDPIIQLLSAEFETAPTLNSFQGTPGRVNASRIYRYSNSRIERFSGGSKYNTELVRRLTRRDIEPLRFEDPFCARLFATRAFPPSTIIKGLTMVGVNEIGPQALRTMALRTEPLTDLGERFRELKQAGITLQGCVFSLALEKFAMENKFELVHSIIESDQHPDVFDDTEMQKKLLDYYLHQKDWVQAHRTLAILTLFHNDPSTESWNILLQARIRQSNYHSVLHILQDMRAKSISVSTESLMAVKGILRLRQRGRNPTTSLTGPFDDLRFVARVYISVLESGIGVIPPIAWREIIRRFGMLGRIRELRRLVLWLMCWYAQTRKTKVDKVPQVFNRTADEVRHAFLGAQMNPNTPPWIPRNNPSHPLHQLFPRSFQQALIVWGFRAGLLANASYEQSMFSGVASKSHYRRKFVRKNILKRVDWTIGLRTLVELRNGGVNINRWTVIKTLRMMLIILFGRGRSLKRENRMMENANVLSYNTYVKTINRIWGEELFQEIKTPVRHVIVDKKEGQRPEHSLLQYENEARARLNLLLMSTMCSWKLDHPSAREQERQTISHISREQEGANHSDSKELSEANNLICGLAENPSGAQSAPLSQGSASGV